MDTRKRVPKNNERNSEVKKPSWKQMNMFGTRLKIMWEEQLVLPLIHYITVSSKKRSRFKKRLETTWGSKIKRNKKWLGTNPFGHPKVVSTICALMYGVMLLFSSHPKWHRRRLPTMRRGTKNLVRNLSYFNFVLPTTKHVKLGGSGVDVKSTPSYSSDLHF